VLRHCIPVLLFALLLALPARAEDITLSVHGDTPAGTVASGVLNAKVQSIKPAGTLRVKVKARGLALGAAPAGVPPAATIAFGAPTAAAGQCGVATFVACRTSTNLATVRCP